MLSKTELTQFLILCERNKSCELTIEVDRYKNYDSIVNRHPSLHKQTINECILEWTGFIGESENFKHKSLEKSIC